MRDGEEEQGGRCVVIGTFDGVHLGHRSLIATARRQGDAAGLGCVIVTFDRHPAETVRPGAVPPLLTDVGHKIELLEQTGVDEVLVLAFDEARAAESAEDFVREILVARLSARFVFVGASFRFGHRAVGDVQLLEEMGTELGFLATGVALYTDEPSHTVVSSTSIRALVAAGDLATANRLLGRPHETRGRLRRGEGVRPWSIEAPPALLLPPPATYRAEAGPLGGPLVPVAARVRAGSRQVELLGEQPGAASADARWRLRYLRS